MKKIACTMMTLFALTGVTAAFADDAAKSENKNEMTTDASQGLDGKATVTKKHKRHHKHKNTDGSETTRDTTTTEKTPAPDNK